MADLNPNSSAGKANIATGVEGGGGFMSGVASGASTGAMLGPWGALVGGLVGGGLSLFDSPQELAMEDLLKKLESEEEYIKSTPFTKDEIMNQLLPQAQKIYRGAADILAGKAGSAVGESGVPKGQAFSEYYTQALAPIIASGEQQAGDAIGKFGMWYSNLDAQAKDRFMQHMRLQLAAASGQAGMSDPQKFFTGAMGGASAIAGIGGEIDILGELQKMLSGKGELTKATTEFGRTV